MSNVNSDGTYSCFECGAKVDRDKPFTHQHCFCGDLYDGKSHGGFEAHAAIPSVKRRHELLSVIHDALGEAGRVLVDDIRAAIWADGSKASLDPAAIGQAIVDRIVKQVELFEMEEAVRVLIDRTPVDTTGLVTRLKSLKAWIEEDPKITGGWSQFGFPGEGIVRPRPAPDVYLSCSPDKGRVLLVLSQREPSRVQSRRSGGELAPISKREIRAIREAIVEAGFTITDDWNNSTSMVVGGVAVGPNIAAARMRNGDPSPMPEGWGTWA